MFRARHRAARSAVGTATGFAARTGLEGRPGGIPPADATMIALPPSTPAPSGNKALKPRLTAQPAAPRKHRPPRATHRPRRTTRRQPRRATRRSSSQRHAALSPPPRHAAPIPRRTTRSGSSPLPRHPKPPGRHRPTSTPDRPTRRTPPAPTSAPKIDQVQAPPSPARRWATPKRSFASFPRRQKTAIRTVPLGGSCDSVVRLSDHLAFQHLGSIK